MESEYLPRLLQAKSQSCLAWVNSLLAYPLLPSQRRDENLLHKGKLNFQEKVTTDYYSLTYSILQTTIKKLLGLNIIINLIWSFLENSKLQILENISQISLSYFIVSSTYLSTNLSIFQLQSFVLQLHQLVLQRCIQTVQGKIQDQPPKIINCLILFLNRMDPAARAAAVSATKSDPGAEGEIFQAGRFIFISSARPQ